MTVSKIIIKANTKYRVTQCVTCGQSVYTEVGTRNWSRVKYCSETCRTKANNKKYAKQRAEWQRRRKDELAGYDPGKIMCLICGHYYTQVGTHIVQRHNMTAREYRKQYGYNLKRGQLPPDYRELKAKRVKDTWNKVKDNLLVKGKASRFKKGAPGIGLYERQPETLENLRILHKKTKAYETLHNRGTSQTRNPKKSSREADDQFWRH